MATKAVLTALTAPGVLDAPSTRFESGGGVAIAQRIREGEVADIAVLASGAIDKLVAEGLLDAGTIRPVFCSEGVIAVPEGAVAPNISSVATVQEVFAAAEGIGYSTGPSGDALLALIDDWGLRDSIGARLVQAPPGVPVASLIAEHRVAIGVQQRSELADRASVRIVGGMPPGAEMSTTFSGAVLTASPRPEDADRVLAALAGPTAYETIRRHHLQPATDQ